MESFKFLPGNRGALVNTDQNALNGYWRNRNKKVELENKIEEINTIKDQISSIMSEQAEIKNLLIKLLEKN